MKTKTKYLAFLLMASALAGGTGQALALAKCGDYPQGSCVTGTRCGAGGIWRADKTCPIAIDRQPDQAEQKEKARAGQGGSSVLIFDRWGEHYKTKASCESAGGGWIKSEGKTSCKPRADEANKQ